jgi:tripartite-type tricarboxylate transporter receptor subunit TctC
MKRRTFLRLATGTLAVPTMSATGSVSVRAADYPTRPVRVIVGFAAGGGTDIVARLIGQSLSERLGQPFVIENRPGAATNLATEVVVNAPADGYTLLLADGSAAIKRRSTAISISISFAISLRSRALFASPISWW